MADNNEPDINSRFMDASWPKDMPDLEENEFFSVLCGNTHYHWALHNGDLRNEEAQYAAKLFWRTPSITLDIIQDMQNAPNPDPSTDDSCKLLATYCPAAVQNILFGASEIHSPETAAAAADARTIRPVTVYVVSTNAKHERGLEYLFSRIPCRLVRLKNSDFLTTATGLYPTLGVDRAAALVAAGHSYGFPALVIDGGTATTFTAADETGTCIGGGILPGIHLKLASLHEYTANLPQIQIETIMATVKECRDHEKPLPVFGKNTQEAMVSALLYETSHNLQGIVKAFMKLKPKSAGNNNKSVVKGQRVNTSMTVCVTGGDSNVFSALLDPNASHVVDPDSLMDNTRSFKVVRHKHLGHSGIEHVLCQLYMEHSGELAKRKAWRTAAASVHISEDEEDQVNNNNNNSTAKQPASASKRGHDDIVVEGDDAAKQDAVAVVQENITPSKKARVEEDSAESEEAESESETEMTTEEAIAALEADPNSALEQRMGKHFDENEGLFLGRIDEYYNRDGTDLWHAVYDDGDQEDLEAEEVVECFRLYKEHLDEQAAEDAE